MPIRKIMPIILCIVGVVVAFVAPRALGNNHTPEMELWPAFVMIFKEEGHIGFVSDGKPGTQTYELV